MINIPNVTRLDGNCSIMIYDRETESTGQAFVRCSVKTPRTVGRHGAFPLIDRVE